MTGRLLGSGHEDRGGQESKTIEKMIKDAAV
jgi:hypothetical protein